MAMGYADDINTLMILSGKSMFHQAHNFNHKYVKPFSALWNGALHFGNFAGPTLSGAQIANFICRCSLRRFKLES
jgi:hypothetical protein